MSEVKIQYVIPDAEHQQYELEQILEAVGSYQDSLPFNVIHTATISEDKNNTVLLQLIRSSRQPQTEYALRERAEEMRGGVESHFSDEDRRHLSQLFAGIAMSGALESE